MNIKAKTTEDKFYSQAFKVLSSIKPYRLLSDKEKFILSYFYTVRRKMLAEGHTMESINNLLFSYNTKLHLMELMGIDDVYYRNCLTWLRKKGFVVKKTIVEQYIPPFMEQIIFTFHLVAEENENRS